VNAAIVLVRAREGENADAPATEVVVDPLLGWGERSARPLEIVDAPGGHSSMLQEPKVEFIANRLIKLLESESADHG
jgi:thioesterase domain-containing protein